MKTENKLILIDSNSLVNRAFYALPPLTNRDGIFTNAILGYMNMLYRLIMEERPTHICAVFDKSAPTFRHEKYAEYKANRKGMPTELAMQIPILQDLLEKMQIKILSKDGIEADDIIGTISKRFKIDTIIVSGDKDVLQLADDTTRIFHTKRGVSDIKQYTPKVLEEEGLSPQKVIEYKGLAGDSSDNIPGASGVGDKTARALLEQYGNIDNIYKNIDSLKGKLKENLLNSRQNVYLSKELATIDTNVDISCSLDDLILKYPFSEEAKKSFQRLEFTKLKFEFSDETKNIPLLIKEEAINTVEVKSEDELRFIVDSIKQGVTVAVFWGEESVSFCFGENEYTIKLTNDLFGNGLNDYSVAEIMSKIYSSDYKNVLFDAKQSTYFMEALGVKAEKPYEDLLLKGYLLNPNIPIKDLKQLLSANGFSDDKNIAYSMLKLNSLLDEYMDKINITKLYREVELPLVECLYDMENAGFLLDKKMLYSLGEEYENELKQLTEKIYELAGEEFNINSNKQLGYILFEKMQLRHGKKNKTGLSVKAEVLEEIEHPIADLLLRYRTIAKLNSTYIEGMKNVISKSSGKVHTVFKQCVTATGRLSSTEPNLQNIPVRKPEGKRLRKMFIPTEGNYLVSADYSQIELRLLAHFSKDEKLIQAYKNGMDIHRLTASKIFNVPFDEVSDEMRSKAKAVNFGIIYGISSFGLAKNAGVSNYEAGLFIKNYFSIYKNVKNYMDENVEKAQTQGYLTTLLGRIRYFPELTSPKYMIREFGKRAAMNMPLQGTASDIIKLAMLNVYRAINKSGLKSKLILQVHDELILDVPKEELSRVEQLLKENMEDVVKLEVPLKINISYGENWEEAK